MYFTYDKDCFYFFQYFAAYFVVLKKILFSYIAQFKKNLQSLSASVQGHTGLCPALTLLVTGRVLISSF